MAMTEFNQFSFQSIEQSTQLYRQTRPSEDFLIKEFFEEPNVTQLFVEVNPFQIQEEESLFHFQRSLSLQFPIQIQKKFTRIVTKTPPKEVPKTQKIKKIGQKNPSKRSFAQSEITKNACFNIVQKAISLIKNQEYEEKLQQLCSEWNVEIEEFREYILKERTRFTGMKTLQIFLGEKGKKQELFGQFLRWFLQEKYIRHAIRSGEMSNLKAYIRFKNDVMLPLLC